MSDRRLTPANGRVAARALELQVSADRFVDGEAAQIVQFAAGLHRDPDGALDRQLVFGETVTVFERRDGWAFVQADKDGYCGYLDAAALAEPMEPSHAVMQRLTHVYPAEGFKAPPVMALTFGARLTVSGGDDTWAEVAWPGGTGLVHRTHLRSLERPLPDLAASAVLFLGTPYLWAGNTAYGIDCSGLIQACCLAAGIACPGDSDLQAGALGVPLDPGAPLARNDLLFWDGHVALVEDGETMIHATAAVMNTVREEIATACARIERAGHGKVTVRRRLTV